MKSKIPSVNRSTRVSDPLVMQLHRNTTVDPVTSHIIEENNWTDGNLKQAYHKRHQLRATVIITVNNLSIFREGRNNL